MGFPARVDTTLNWTDYVVLISLKTFDSPAQTSVFANYPKSLSKIGILGESFIEGAFFSLSSLTKVSRKLQIVNTVWFYRRVLFTRAKLNRNWGLGCLKPTFLPQCKTNRWRLSRRIMADLAHAEGRWAATACTREHVVTNRGHSLCMLACRYGDVGLLSTRLAPPLRWQLPYGAVTGSTSLL